MPPHHQIIAIRPRSLDNVLADLREARADLEVANTSMLACEPDADDRYTEAETRMEDLREEFDERLLAATGLTVEALMKAREECLL